MPRNGSGGYTPPLNSWNPPINGAAAQPADWQAILSDLATAIQASIAADGQTPITGVLNFSNNRISGVGAPIGQGNALRWEQLTKGANIASATSIDIPVEGAFFEITGTTDIAAITDTYPGRVVFLKFQDVLTLEHSAALVMPTGSNIETAAGDVAIFVNETTGVWKCVYYPIVLAAGVDYDNTASGLAATNVQAAIDELATEKLDADKNIVLGTAVTLTNQTAVDFTGIPATAKRITVMFNGVSTTGNSPVELRLGTLSGLELAGYDCATVAITTSTPVFATSSTGLRTHGTVAGEANDVFAVLTNVVGETWTFNASGVRPANSVAALASGSKTLADTLTTVRITTVNGTDQFDAGTINISWE